MSAEGQTPQEGEPTDGEQEVQPAQTADGKPTRRKKGAVPVDFNTKIRDTTGVKISNSRETFEETKERWLTVGRAVSVALGNTQGDKAEKTRAVGLALALVRPDADDPDVPVEQMYVSYDVPKKTRKRMLRAVDEMYGGIIYKRCEAFLNGRELKPDLEAFEGDDDDDDDEEEGEDEE